MKKDYINPNHYRKHPSKVECITITEHMNFCLGNAMKYIWRADLKDDAVQDLQKAVWYLNREIKKRQKKPENLFDKSGHPLVGCSCLYISKAVAASVIGLFLFKINCPETLPPATAEALTFDSVDKSQDFLF